MTIAQRYKETASAPCACRDFNERGRFDFFLEYVSDLLGAGGGGSKWWAAACLVSLARPTPDGSTPRARARFSSDLASSMPICANENECRYPQHRAERIISCQFTYRIASHVFLEQSSFIVFPRGPIQGALLPQ